MNENLRSFNTDADSPTQWDLSFVPESRTFQALLSHWASPRYSLLHHTNTQGTGRANDGADNRGQGHILEGKGVILSFDAGDLIHVLQCHQAGHLFPWEQSTSSPCHCFLPEPPETQMPTLTLTCVPGPLLNPSGSLQEVGNSGLANFYFKCSVRLKGKTELWESSYLSQALLPQPKELLTSCPPQLTFLWCPFNWP